LQSHYLFQEHFLPGAAVRNEEGECRAADRGSLVAIFLVARAGDQLLGSAQRSIERSLRGGSSRANTWGRLVSKSELLKEDQAGVPWPLPKQAFEASSRGPAYKPIRSRSSGFDDNDYSVPVQYAHRRLTVGGDRVLTLRLVFDDRLGREALAVLGKRERDILRADPLSGSAGTEARRVSNFAKTAGETGELPELLGIASQAARKLTIPGTVTRSYIQVLRLLEKFLTAPADRSCGVRTRHRCDRCRQHPPRSSSIALIDRLQLFPLDGRPASGSCPCRDNRCLVLPNPAQ